MTINGSMDHTNLKTQTTINLMVIMIGLLAGPWIPQARAVPQPTHYKFSGETLKAQPSWDTRNCKSVRSQLFWHQPSHTSPMGEVQVSRCEEEIQVKLPQVGRISQYELVIEVFSTDQWNNADLLRIQVYPRNLMDPLRDWAGKNSLKVADSVGKLDAVLKFFKIPYEKIFGFEPPAPQAIMKVGHREYIFQETETPIPKIWIKEDRVEFEMKILDDLPNNPLLQSELMQIMEEDFTVSVQPNTDALGILSTTPSGN